MKQKLHLHQNFYFIKFKKTEYSFLQYLAYSFYSFFGISWADLD